jgi:hypothetical protein
MGVRAAQKGLATLCIGSDWRRLLRSENSHSIGPMAVCKADIQSSVSTTLADNAASGRTTDFSRMHRKPSQNSPIPCYSRWRRSRVTSSK